MFDTHHNQLKELRKEIRNSKFHKNLYERCLDAYKTQNSLIKRAETKLRKIYSGKDQPFPENLNYIFTSWLESKNIRSLNRKKELINAKLTQIAAIRIQAFLKERVDTLSKEKRLTKGLETQEKHVIAKIEKLIDKTEDPKASSIIPFILSVENLTIDQEEIKDLYNLGFVALTKLKESIKSLDKISEFAVQNFESSPEKGELAFRTYTHIIEGYMYICAFTNELKEYEGDRDSLLHLNTLQAFMNTYINFLIIDWAERQNIRQSLLYIRNTIKVIETLLTKLATRIIKTKGELSITSQELSALLKRLNLI